MSGSPQWHLGRKLLSVAVGVIVTFASLASASAQQTADEYRLKAAFIYHIAQFTQWPEDALRPGDPLLFCTIGYDPFRGGLEKLVEGKSISSRRLRVRHLQRFDEVRGCHVAFIAREEAVQVPGLLAMAKNSPTLVVGETEGFAQQGGTLGFYLENSKIRFDINLAAANSSRLKISSRLLQLAKSVVGEREQK